MGRDYGASVVRCKELGVDLDFDGRDSHVDAVSDDGDCAVVPFRCSWCRTVDELSYPNLIVIGQGSSDIASSAVLDSVLRL